MTEEKKTAEELKKEFAEKWGIKHFYSGFVNKPEECLSDLNALLDKLMPTRAFPQFGDYCTIEQKRYGWPNEHYTHKVIGTLKSNTWVDVPVQSPATETCHYVDELVDVVACVCEGINEREILRYRVLDVRSRMGGKKKCTRLQDNTDGICPDCGGDHYEGRNV